jgi:CubicO group peptidase (beta-lactamase class C family)
MRARQALLLLSTCALGLPIARAECYSAPTTTTTDQAAGRTDTFVIYISSGCPFLSFPPPASASQVSWITLRSDIWYEYASAAAFAFDVARNTGAARTGTIILGGITFTVRQLGATVVLPVTGPAVPALASLDTLMLSDMNEFGPLAGTLAVSYQGRLVYARGFGYADRVSLELVQPDSLFRLASVSKLMTMAAIANLENQGILTPSSKAFTILNNLGPPPGLTVVDPRWYDITVDELINQTGGFLRTYVDRALDFNYLESATAALGEIMPGDNTSVIRYAMSQPLEYTPGQPPNPCPDCYSNFGYQILGRIIEKVTGQTYEDYIQSAIMAPAGVARTRAAQSFDTQRAAGEVEYYVNSVELWGDSVFANQPGPALWTYGSFAYEHFDSFGGMISNAMDVLRFYLYWLNWGAGSGYYGSLPGTNTAVFTLTANSDVKYSFLFDYRSDSDYSRTNTSSCTTANPCDLQVAVHNDLETALAGINSWPPGDFDPLYSGPNPACSFSVLPAALTVDQAQQSQSVNVTVAAGCSWDTVSDTGWVAPAITSGTGSQMAGLNLSANTTGAQRSAIIYVAGQPLTITQTAAIRPAGLRDFRGIGLSDAVIYDPVSGQEYTALSNGGGTYSYVPNLFTAAFDTMRTGDFNGDGKADLVLYNSLNALAYIGMSNGDGTFAFQSLFWSPGYNYVEAGDLNGDGKTDFALYNSSTGTMYAGLSNGNGTFTYKYTLISKGYTFLRLADFTGDGMADIFVYNAATGAAFLGAGDGTGGFTFHALSMSPGYNLIDIGDLNGDGKMDIIVYNSTSGNAATGISDGMGGFTFKPLIFSAGFTWVRLADYTGRATADLTVYDKNNAVAYFGTGDGAGGFDFQSLFWSPDYVAVEPQDVNGDGKTDVILYNSSTGTEYTGISNGDGTFTYTYSLWGPGKILAR